MNYENISLEVADNGFILNFCEKKEKSSEYGSECCGSMYDREYRKQVYSFDKGIDALNAMKKMHGTNKAFPMKKEEKPMESEDMMSE